MTFVLEFARLAAVSSFEVADVSSFEVEISTSSGFSHTSAFIYWSEDTVSLFVPYSVSETCVRSAK